MLFDDGSELHVRECVDVTSGIECFKYSYHSMRGERMIFRYDNAADIAARDCATYPHHKHGGEVIQASPAPTLREVLEEIVAQLS